MSFTRFPRITLSARQFSTSISRQQGSQKSPMELLRGHLDQKVAQSGTAGPSSASSVLGEDRKVFKKNEFLRPQAFTAESLSPEPRPRARSPLLGPPKKIAAKLDPFHITKTNPLSHDLNPHYAYEFVNAMGKIRSRAETGLTWKSQRRVGKLVRRARAMGLISRWVNRPVPGGMGSVNRPY
ncbi:ribosomal protein S18 [Cryptococcus wingfieldii CBS 7118]|uniref:Small ribosomal subunit protein bS18m n=1 Tax=Cryptococcus wingfieldii CBS 7118 TaxID=1295528 RepID=A0A1E3K5C6_9TREE|nr:ribosomal protein S18 [Cryptococcus wingfieldii CBS 7118]ODO08404.1 ribosomal protein S18 [Cryptococcus wingfieldii CBS 7118]